jgi:3-oxoadipate enol-lactonase
MLAQPTLAGRYRAILYHRRGYAGSSRAEGAVSLSQQAGDCRAVLRRLGIDRAHVVGHSSGGSVALQLALDAPELVHSLALLEPALMVGESAEGYRASLVLSAERYREAGAEVVIDAFLQARSPGYRALLDRELPGSFAQALADAATPFEHELPGLIDWQFGEVEARRVRQPALSVLGGDSEALWSRFGETHRWLLAQLPNVEGCVLPGTTHLLHVEDPRGMADALVAFWSRHPIPAPAA